MMQRAPRALGPAALRKQQRRRGEQPVFEFGFRSRLLTAFGATIGRNWLEVIKALAPVVTAFIAFSALKNWQRQDKAKREADFLDALIEAAHTYSAEMSKPITILEMAKVGMVSHAPTWENSEQADIEVKGAITYTQKYGEREAKRLQDVLETVQPSVVKLRSLGAKGPGIQVRWLCEMLECGCDAHVAFRQDTSIRDCYRVAEMELGTSGSAEALERHHGNRPGRNTREPQKEQYCPPRTCQ